MSRLAAPDTRTVQLPGGVLQLRVEENGAGPDPWPLDELLGFGARQNPRRSFLFVSRVLGKHVPVSPLTMQRTHAALAGALGELQGPVLLIGLAETATGLAEGVARCWTDARPGTPATYLHTTRYACARPTALHFEEPHSHATAHRLVQPDGDPFLSARTLVLIDDELSTGTTLRNLTRAYRALNPSLEAVVVVSLTDWCAGRDRLDFGVPARFVSLLRGQYTFAPDPAHAPPALPAVTGSGADKTALLAPLSARHGQDARGNPHYRAALAQVQAELNGAAGRVLILGTGEFQYLPYRLAREVQAAQPALSVRNSATTRSPVLVWGAVGQRLEFSDNYGDDMPNYLYNVAPGEYDHVYIGHEGAARPDPALLTTLRATALRLA